MGGRLHGGDHFSGISKGEKRTFEVKTHGVDGRKKRFKWDILAWNGGRGEIEK